MGGNFRVGFQFVLPVDADLFGVVGLAVLEFADLAVVPVTYRTVVTGDAGVYFGVASAFGTGEVLAPDITVFRADGLGGGQGVVWQLEVLGDLAYQGGGRLPVRQALA